MAATDPGVHACRACPRLGAIDDVSQPGEPSSRPRLTGTGSRGNADVESSVTVQSEVAAGDAAQPLARAQISAEAKQMDTAKFSCTAAACLRQPAHDVLGAVITEEVHERGRACGQRP